MKWTKATLLFHPLFLLSLFILLCNDFYWKHQFHNWLTGKLSDVAGLVVLPLFVMAFFPKQKKRILLFTALFFSWWKSSLSETIILFINQTFSLSVGRVVDYTDLFTLPVLFIAGAIKPFILSLHRRATQCFQWTLGTITVFALCATSMPYRSLFMAHPNSNDVYFHENFTRKKSADAILQTLAAKEIPYRLDSVMYYPLLNQRNIYYRKQANDSTLFIKREVGPYYVIPDYSATIGTKTVTLRNIRFTLSENRNRSKTKIVVETFESPGLSGFMNNQTRDNFKALFRAIFSAR